ncbi:hypothetical protein PE067_14090 [Paracoccus sp. DMF-8]|uniref:hypothetical protein n=1 Tax=Paracoccus sp. DMF-8 TaxID=3019445 RepID=UPI0023E7B3FC|nr:hypothetical protein [Paracoccus sp. DMF-8]MDF3607166.1 hypothetical protein [Paracoccus sp. DMF-8]
MKRTCPAHDNRAYRATKLDVYRIMAASMAIHYMGLRFVQAVVMAPSARASCCRGKACRRGGFCRLSAAGRRVLSARWQKSPQSSRPIRGIAGYRRYQELLATEPEIGDSPDAITAPALRGEIVFDDVPFSDDETRPGSA